MTFLATGNGDGLPYLPGAPLARRHVKVGTSIEDLFPFTSILEIKRIVARLADSLYAASGSDRLHLFDTALALLATKFYDELANSHSLQLPHAVSSSDSKFADLRSRALRHFGVETFAPDLRLANSAIREALRGLLPYSLRQTIQLSGQVEILGTFYQDIVSSTFRGSLGAYFTPKPIADLAAQIYVPGSTDAVFDISCGSGTFLLSAYSKAREQGSAGPALFGCDIQARMVLATILNCIFHGVNNPHITRADGLRLDLGLWRSSDKSIPRDGFDLIVGNPPFAGFDTVSSAPSAGAPSQRTNAARVHKVIPFIDRVLSFLKPGGRAALVVPTSVLNGEAGSFRNLRSRLAQNTYVTTLVALPREAFVHTDCGVEGALLFFERRGADSRRPLAQTFFSRVDSLGYDRRGKATSGSDVSDTVRAWRARDPSSGSWIATKELLTLDRWDPFWLRAHVNGGLTFQRESHLRLTDLCDVVDRPLRRRDVAPGAKYAYFEVGDTDLDTGEILRVHHCTGADVLAKGRLRLLLEGNEVLLPNHRDSLIAKTAVTIGRSAVLVPKEFAGIVTSDRFTSLQSKIDPQLLVALLNSRVVRDQLVLQARGSASFDIRDKVLEHIWVPRALVSEEKASLIRALFQRREDLRSMLKSTIEEIHSALT